MITARLARLGLALVLGFAIGGPLSVQAQGATPPQVPAVQPPMTRADSILENKTRQVASELRCPVCQGLSIQDSPSELALQMRDVVKDQLRSGKSPDEVRQYFVDRYGEWILLEPEPAGMNLLVYVLPVLAVAAGLGFVWLLIRRWTAQVPVSAPALGDADE